MDSTMDSSSFGVRLKSEIDRLGMDNHRLMKFTGLSKVNLENLLQRNSSPTREIMRKLASIPNINMAYIEAKKSAVNVPTNRHEAAAQLLTNLPEATFEPFASALTAVYQPFVAPITGASTASSYEQKPGYTFGNRLRSERERLGLSRSEISRMCDFPRGSMMNWENGRYLPNGEAMLKLSQKTELDMVYIMSGVRTLKLTAEEEALIERLRRVPRPIRLAAHALVAKAADSI
ncbi:helix-turn-helix transcriptional regulator [Acidovorax delafieldii]